MAIPAWTGEWFWDELGQFTTPGHRIHHGERGFPDWSAPGDSVAISWHWDRICFWIIELITSNTCDVQTSWGYNELRAHLRSEGRQE
eukprot:12537618-Heterocapsa_arctica.AAC.1